MATSAFKSTTRRAPIGTSSPSTDDSPTSSSSKAHRRSRSVSRFSRPLPIEIEPDVDLTPRPKFVNTVGGSDFPEISLDDLSSEFFAKDECSELEDESVSCRNSRRDHVKSEITPPASHRRSRSVSRHPNGGGSAIACSDNANSFSQRRGRSVSRRNDGSVAACNAGSTTRFFSNADSRRRRSVSVARCQINDAEGDIDFSRSSASQPKPRSMNNGTSRVASFQRPTASSHRRLTRSMSQAPQLRSYDGYLSQSSTLTDDDLRDARYGRNEIEKTIRAVYAQKKIDYPSGDDANHGLYETMRKELRSAVNEIMIELEQTMERVPSALSVHDRLYSNKSDATTRKSYTTKLKQPEKRKQDISTERALEEQQHQDEYKIVREVIPKSKSNAKTQTVSFPGKRSNDRNRICKRLNEEAEKYFEDFISNIEDTDFSSFDGERSDTSSTLVGSTTKQNGVTVEMEGINLPWLKFDDNDGVHPTTPKTKLWDPSQDLELIQEHRDRSSISHGSWNPELKEIKSTRFDMGKYFDLERTEELLFDSWRERSVIRSGGLLLCGVIAPILKPY